MFLFCSLLFDLRPNCGGGNEDNLLWKVPCTHCYTQCSQPCSRPPPTPSSTRDSYPLTGKLGQSLMESLLLFLCPGAHKVLHVLQESISQSCVSSGIYGGVNGDLIHEGLCHTQVCCTQSPCSCGSLPPTHTSTGDAQTQFCLSLCGVPESWCTQGFVWALWASLMGIGFDSKSEFTPLPSCWGFPFALRCGVSSHSCSAPCSRCSSPYHLVGFPWPWT